MSASPSPSPPSDPLGGEKRFKRLNTACEWVEDYRPGRFHPVDIGDMLCNGQYRVIRKLGYGSFSTVWLAHDTMKNMYVALKIATASASLHSKRELPEVTLYRHLASRAAQGRASAQLDRYMTRLLDTFDLRGPNGAHKCLVFEPMGPTVNSMVDELPEFKPRMLWMTVRCPLWMAKQILRGALEALDYLHEHGIAHGDVQPGNMLFSLRSSLDKESETTLWQPDNPPDEVDVSISDPIERLDGKIDLWAPKHLYVPMPLAEFADCSPGFRIKLSDLGGAYFLSEHPKESVTPTGLRAPELVLQPQNESIPTDGKKLDVWSVGCLLFELVTGRPLFCISGRGGRSRMDDSHLLSFWSVLGPLPPAMCGLWVRWPHYLRKEQDGERGDCYTLYNSQVVADSTSSSSADTPNKVRRVRRIPPPMPRPESMEEMFDIAAPVASVAEAHQIKRLIRRILHYDPAQRPTMAEILQDDWFSRDDWHASKEEKESWDKL